jgi:signal transduction histidine kinase
MKNTTECAKVEGMTGDGQAQLIRRLAHDLRQPLSSIECIGYYLDMVLGDQEPELQKQCETLRRMVQQAHWLLEDASLAATVRDAECGPVALDQLLAKLGGEMALHEQRSLELRLDEGAVALAPAAETAGFCRHVLAFFRNVAQAEDPIVVTAEVGLEVRLEISALIHGEPYEMSRMVEPPEGGGLRAFVEAAQGQMTARVEGRRLALTFWLRRCE